MFSDFIYEKYINISIEKIDNFLKQKNINITINEIHELLGDDYCLNILSKCKKKKGYLCLQCLNKKTKKCKIHKINDKYFDCISRCNTPVLEDEHSKENNIYSENEEDEIKEKPDNDEFVNINKKDNNENNLNINYEKNNNHNIFYEKEKINISKNSKNDKLPDFELTNLEVTYRNNELFKLNEFTKKLIKINSQSFEQIIEGYNSYINNKDNYSKYNIMYYHDLFELIEDLDGDVIEKTKNIWKISKSFMQDCLNNDIKLSNNNFKRLFNSIFEYTNNLIFENPLLIKFILDSDYDVLNYHIENVSYDDYDG